MSEATNPPIYLVATGVIVCGEETYTRHEGHPPPMCDFEGPLYSASDSTARAAPTDENADWLKGYTAGQSLAHAYYDNPQIKEARSIIESAAAALRVGGTARAEPVAMREALQGLVEIIDAAKLINLSAGVQLGQTSWYVKAWDRLEAARAAISQSAGTLPQTSDVHPVERSGPLSDAANRGSGT